jgi:signal transduction histidine kinase
LSFAGTTARLHVGPYGLIMDARQQLRRHGDLVIAVTLFLLAQVELASRHPPHDVGGLARSAILAACTLPIALRRRRPLLVVVMVSVIGEAATAASGNVDTFYAVGAGSLIMYYSVAAYAARWSWVGLSVGLLSFWADDAAMHHPASEYVASAVLVSGPWLAGRALRHQRAQSAQLRQLAADLATERERAEAAAVSAERGRIASEMHDVVAHALSIIAVQADAASAALDVQPSLATTAVEAIREVSRESLDEMRRVLHVLHEPLDSTGSPPTLRDLDRLIARVRDSGLAVVVETAGDLDRLPPAVDLAGYRVVQEALTNVRKHARTRHAGVRIAHAGGELVVAVTSGGATGDGAPRLTSGYGLRGLRDRVEAHGGCFEAGVKGDDWLVVATIPVPTAVAR